MLKQNAYTCDMSFKDDYKIDKIENDNTEEA